MTRILKERSFRRMQFIRQLGLKAFIDFPNAIHTRYSHVLGVMHLAGKITNRLINLESISGRKTIHDLLVNNKNNLLAAALLHDIGHGPFSHVIDFILKEYCDTDHETKSFEFIDQLGWMDSEGLNIEQIKKIIKGNHDYKFLNHIITGPLDCDKMDYLLRDSYHVGLKYSFDLNHFIGNFRILGESSNFSDYELGLENNITSIKTAEIFLIIWKNMYDLVYHIRDSRIAEKMIEKAVIVKINKDPDFLNNFKDNESYLELDDERLLKILAEESNEVSSNFVKNVRNNSLYQEIDSKHSKDLESFFPSKLEYANFLHDLEKGENKVSDSLSRLICNQLKCHDYDIICDVIKSRKPKQINLNTSSSNEPLELSQKSEIIRAIKEDITLKIYSKKNFSTEELKEGIKYSVNNYNQQ
jgi:HD superfamily phosphohydrolase